MCKTQAVVFQLFLAIEIVTLGLKLVQGSSHFHQISTETFCVGPWITFLYTHLHLVKPMGLCTSVTGTVDLFIVTRGCEQHWLCMIILYNTQTEPVDCLLSHSRDEKSDVSSHPCKQ